MNFRAPQSDDVDVNLTPLIDVVFLLLIFFMVSTSFVKESQIKLSLPEASDEVQELPADTIEVAVDENGVWFVNGHALADRSDAALSAALAEVSREQGEPVLVISADRSTPHQDVIDIMDVARRLGLSRITFPVEVEAD